MSLMSRTQVRLHRIQSIYNLMQTGKLLVPAFQRGFAWSRSHVRGLLESIYRGYPIGTILVIEDRAARYPVLSSQESLFPPVDQEKLDSDVRVWYVLDGSQRLAALYNTFFGDNANFEFWFDLEAEEFTLKRKLLENRRCVSLRSLYSNEFRDAFVQIAMAEEAGILLDRMNRLHTAFKDYELIVQVLIDMTLDDAIEVYERMNSSGRRLSRADIEKIRRKHGSS